MDFSSATREGVLQSPVTENGAQPSRPHDSRGWDGKARVEKRAVIANPGTLSDSDNSDEEIHPPEQIAADEGKSRVWSRFASADL